MHAPAITFEVANRFHDLRRRYFLARLVACLGFGTAALLLGWMVLAVCDYFWELPLVARRGLMIGLSIAIVAFILWESTRTASDSRSRRFVGRLERQFDSLGQRLRTLLDTVEGKLRAPEAMLSALGHQTMGRWETAQPAQVIPHRLVVAALFGAGFMACVVLIGYFASGEDWRIAMRRAIGYEAPYTRLVVTPGDARLLEGTQLSVQLELQGRTNRECLLRYRNSDSSEWAETTLEPSDNQPERSARFVANLGKITQSVEYQFVTSVGATRNYTVTMQPFIEVEDLSSEVTPPAYTHLAGRTFSSAELSVLQGSQVKVTLKTNHPLSQVRLQVGQNDKTFAAVDVAEGDDPSVWSFELPSSQSVQWRFAGNGEDGTPMNAVRGRLSVRHDQPPKLEWQEPVDELTVHMLAEVPMQLQVSDDYGVLEAGIVFQLGDEDEFVLKQWLAESEESSADSDDVVTTRIRLAETLPLESFALSEKDFVTYYAFAKDNRADSPQHVESEMRYVDIRPLKQYWSELDALPQPGRGSGAPGLDEIIRRQRFLINRTRTLARSSPSSGPERVGVIERLVESQSELADLTRFLVEFLNSRGNDDTESLSQAEAAMLQAADSFSIADFDTALVQEQDALRFLAEARRTLELTLQRNNSMQQQRALDRFRRQMQQRLRRNAKQSDAKLADTLQQIADEQMQIAKDAAKISLGPNTQTIQTESPSASAAQPNPDAKPNPDAQPNSDAQANPDAQPNSDAQPSAEAQPSGDAQPNPVAQPSGDDPGAQLHMHQQELLDRLAEIDSALSSDVKRSELVTRRLEQATSEMDQLVTEAGEKNWSVIPTRGKLLAEQLHELASHIDALAKGEPVKRVAAARDMTTSLANMEGELSNTELSVVSALEDGFKPGSKTDAAALENLRAKGEGLSRRLQARVDTLADLLIQPVDAVDLAGSEVYERLLEVAEELALSDKLTSSRSAVGEPGSQKETTAWANTTMNRATEYADIAMHLETLYRQLVAPRLDNLRQLEAKANALKLKLDAKLKGDGSGGMAENKIAEKAQGGKSAEMLLQELEQGLIAAGLEDLAQELREDVEDGESEEDASATSSDLAAGAMAGRRPHGMFSINQIQATRGRVIRVDRQLQEILRDLIFIEISADRNTPVPPEYKELVDRYFRSIAEDNVPATEVSK